MTTEDLWGELPNADSTVKPSTLLREQASLLASKTSNVLEGVVNEFNTGTTSVLGFSFLIRCPAMDNYTFQVLSLTHDLLNIFPVSVRDKVGAARYEATDENELRRILKEIFTSNEVRRIIAALLREATATA